MNTPRYVKFLVFIVAAMLMHSCFEEIPYAPNLKDSSSLLFINHKPVFDDPNREIMLFPVDEYGSFKGLVTNNDERKLYVDGEIVRSDFEFDFGKINKNTSVEIRFEANNGEQTIYNLFFTLLPLIKVEYNYEAIPDEPKYPAKITIVSTGNDVWFECIGIEMRGGSSLSRLKKSYGIEIWEDMNSRNNKNISIFNMYNDDDWILDAVYRDSSRVRNRVSFDIWSEMQADAMRRGYETMYSGTKGRYVELFLNNNYYGLYCFSERIEAKMLDIKTEQSGKQGYLYKSENWTDATKFESVPELVVDKQGHWSGWEQRYPKPENGYDWQPLYNFIDFVANSSDDVFYEQISEKLVLEQAMDYYILVNILLGADNAGKNIILSSKSSDGPFYFIPWDLDATWGRDWLGFESGPGGIVSFNLFKRIMDQNPDDFCQRLQDRYFELREQKLATVSLNNQFRYYFNILDESGAITRENERWPDSKVDLTKEMNYLSEWIEKRANYLENYFLKID
ncbi:MAG: CotH kinase family protein [Prolixibacteraceae bacterium]|jgi:spore coat protein H|nr:CotH kinase family protein [Prolixibacteraceae bacterium]